MNNDDMVYVAADPKQPGTAWAVCADEPKHADHVAETLADWVRRGAHIMRVDVGTAREMMTKWQRPEKRRADESQGSLI